MNEWTNERTEKEQKLQQHRHFHTISEVYLRFCRCIQHTNDIILKPVSLFLWLWVSLSFKPSAGLCRVVWVFVWVSEWVSEWVCLWPSRCTTTTCTVPNLACQAVARPREGAGAGAGAGGGGGGGGSPAAPIRPTAAAAAAAAARTGWRTAMPQPGAAGSSGSSSSGGGGESRAKTAARWHGWRVRWAIAAVPRQTGPQNEAEPVRRVRVVVELYTRSLAHSHHAAPPVTVGVGVWIGWWSGRAGGRADDRQTDRLPAFPSEVLHRVLCKWIKTLSV